MNLAALDLNLLVALDALLDTASVGGAASKVALSQPAMSHALKRLRTVLADPLLVRIGTRMQLTTRGKALRLPVREVLSRVRDLVLPDRFEPASSTRTFELFVSDYAGDLLLPLLRKHLQEAAPGVSIRVHSEARIQPGSREPEQEADIVISCLPASFRSFYQQRLFTDRDACAMRRGHPLAERIWNPADFLKAKHVAVIGREFAGSAAEDPVDSWLRQEGCRRDIALTVPHYLQALHVVAQSDLIGVIPERLIRMHSASLGLEVLPVPMDVGTFDEYLLHPATKHFDPGCAFLRGVVQSVARSFEVLGTHHPNPVNRRPAKNRCGKRKPGPRVRTGAGAPHSR